MITPKAVKWAGLLLGVLVLVLATAQLARPERQNLTTDPSHTIQATLAAPNALGPVLDRACGDCHSNTMSSRWYAQVVPFSFVMARGAKEGRKAVNFAEWTAYAPERQRELLHKSCREAKRGTMPMAAYTWLRPDAKLSALDVETICGAAQ